MPRLEAPSSYREASVEDRRALSSGCGPRTRFGLVSKAVPDHLLGVDVSEACEIHDWEYANAEEPRSVADARFHRNLTKLVDSRGGPLRWFRRCLAWWYYKAVAKHGEASYGGKLE